MSVFACAVCDYLWVEYLLGISSELHLNIGKERKRKPSVKGCGFDHISLPEERASVVCGGPAGGGTGSSLVKEKLFNNTPLRRHPGQGFSYGRKAVCTAGLIHVEDVLYNVRFDY